MKDYAKSKEGILICATDSSGKRQLVFKVPGIGQVVSLFLTGMAKFIKIIERGENTMW